MNYEGGPYYCVQVECTNCVFQSDPAKLGGQFDKGHTVDEYDCPECGCTGTLAKKEPASTYVYMDGRQVAQTVARANSTARARR